MKLKKCVNCEGLWNNLFLWIILIDARPQWYEFDFLYPQIAVLFTKRISFQTSEMKAYKPYQRQSTTMTFDRGTRFKPTKQTSKQLTNHPAIIS